MMKRRSFLVGGSSLALGQLMSGCNPQQQASLNVQLLKGSIPAQMLNEFRKGLKLPAKLDFAPENQLNDLFKRLKIWKQQAGKKENQQWLPLPFISDKTPELANLVTLGDYWLEQAIHEKLIQPLDLEDGKGWQQLPPRWKELVRRNAQGQLTKNGQVWGAPYRWGTTVIAYRRDKFEELGWTPKDWSDLWRPELRDRISLLDQPREVIGLTLKKLGLSYNHKNLSQVPNLKEELLKLHQQVKYYSSDNYLEALLLGDTWLALGWSTDVLSVRGSYRQIDAVVPLSGTALWADVWVQPTSLSTSSNLRKISAPSKPPTDVNPNVSLAKQWIEFCWQPQSAKEISVLSNAASPIFAEVEPTNLPKDLQDNHLRLPDSSIVKKSEFIEPLPEAVSKEYEKLWIQIRSVKRN
ncbi:extracellular solute-binding protein [Allocoleopsis sp.]|uniref:extracellular solute-binding protein n=1 Tax=Allocoleopsis sp. TaxID=3088169 RepID=UPI002FCFDE53